MDIHHLLVLGGMAHDKGVTFFGRHYEVRASWTAGDRIHVETKKLPGVPGWVIKGLHIPLMRGFVGEVCNLYMSRLLGLITICLPVFMIIGADIFGKHSFADLPGFIKGIMIGAPLGLLALGIMGKTGEMAKYHGAEHVLHNLYLQGKERTLWNARQASRFHEWCGTSWLMILMIYALIMIVVPIALWFKVLLWFVFYGEFTLNHNRFIRVLFFPIKMMGFLMQCLTTSKPDEKHLQVAQSAFEQLLEKESQKHAV